LGHVNARVQGGFRHCRSGQHPSADKACRDYE
jgi:hypothetical protein